MKHFCPTCGYANEAGLGTSLTCRSCGASFTVPTAPAPAPVIATTPAAPLNVIASAKAPYHPAAIASVVLGVLPCIPFAGLGAIIAGAIALKALSDARGAYRGRELALVGMGLGALSIALVVLAVIAQALTHR